MLTRFGFGALLAVSILAATGDPLRLSPVPQAASAAELICTSTNYQYSYCRTGGAGRVALIDQLSRAPCQQGRSWGYDGRGVWVNNGCAARFGYGGGGSGGSVAGALIVGGLIGALVGGAAADNHAHVTNNYYDRSPYYSRPYPAAVERRRDTSQDTDYSVQKFDKDGNPNYDENGSYQGGRGVGTLVDNPDSGESGSGDSDPDGSGGPG